MGFLDRLLGRKVAIVPDGPVDGGWVRSVRLAPARRGYDRGPVEALLDRCAATFDAFAAPDGPPPGVDLVTPEDVERFEVRMAGQGVDPMQVDEILDRIRARLAELQAGAGG